MPDTNRRRSSRHLRLLVRATRQIPISASPLLGHPEDWVVFRDVSQASPIPTRLF
jgi:hypothetical protein